MECSVNPKEWMQNSRYYTLLIVPEKSSKVRKIVIPKIFLKIAIVGISLSTLGFAVMTLSYLTSKDHAAENTVLLVENRALREKIQLLNTRVASIDTTLDRVKNFVAKIKTITNYSPNMKKKIKRLHAYGPLTAEESMISKLNEEQFLNDALFTSHPTLQDRKVLDEPEWASKPDKVDVISSEVGAFEVYLQHLEGHISEKQSILASTPSIRPLKKGWVSSPFGRRLSPFTGKLVPHLGVDIAAKEGAEIIAPADGIVTFVGKKPGYGKTLIIKHGYGVETLFGHNSDVLVKKGQLVYRGMKIAKVGNTGRSTGPHLHYEVLVNRRNKNPFNYFLN